MFTGDLRARHSLIYKLAALERCGHDGQRKRVAHVPTATKAAADSWAKWAKNHPNDFTMSQNF
jgi:hypothetical protein